MTSPGSLEERVAALEAAVRELQDRLDNPPPYLAAEDPQVKRALERYPDLRVHLPEPW